MKMFKFYLIASGLLIAFSTNAQKSPKKGSGTDYSKFSVSVGGGIANYYGDLIKKKINFTQFGGSLSAGAQYAFSPRIAARFDLGYEKLQGSDSKSGGAYPDRNLSFKSNVFDFSLAAEFTVLNLDKFPISPYVSAGAGVVVFDPYAYNGVTGQRQNLHDLNTEGQGLPGYAASYNRSALEFPLGVGVKYRANDQLTLALDFNYRITQTDYLDDVSSNYYPSKAVLDARNPLTSQYTFRGKGAYPGLTLPRGNPDNNDGFFTTQLKLVFKLK
jgi:opacity protein-like surface antigen